MDPKPPTPPGAAQHRELPVEGTGRRFGWFEDLVADTKFYLRSLLQRGNRAFAIVAVLTLALGIGTATAIFSVAYGLLYDAYPYENTSEIWSPWINFPPNANNNITRLPRLYVTEMEKLPGVAAVMSSSRSANVLTNLYIDAPNAPNGRELYPSVVMSGNAFAFLGVKPTMGRTITSEDIEANGTPKPVIVLSEAAWKRFLPGEKDPIGKIIPFKDNQGGARPMTVIGVMPARFGGNIIYDIGNTVWTPMQGTNLDAAATTMQVRPRVRLKPGITKEVGEQQIRTLVADVARNNQASPFWIRTAVGGTLGPWTLRESKVTLRDFVSATFDAQGVFRANMRYLSFGVAFLLLIACMNVANLQLARAAGRSREIAIRLAVGAARTRLVRQLLTESVILSLAGALLGLLVAYGFTQMTLSLMPPNMFGGAPLPDEARIGLNGNVLLFSAVVAIISGILFGMAPAIQSTRPDLNNALKDGSKGSGGVQGARIRSGLVIAEMAFAIMLLVVASLSLWSYVRLVRVDPGFNPERLYNVTTIGLQSKDPRFDALLERIRSVPFVESVSRAYNLGGTSRYTVEGQTRDDTKMVRTAGVDVGFLDAMGMKLLRGRNFTPDEVSRGEPVALVGLSDNSLWAEGEDPVGKQITVDTHAATAMSQLVNGVVTTTPATPPPVLTVVGVISNMRQNVTADPIATVIAPYSLRNQSIIGQLALRIKEGQSPNVQAELQAVVKAFDPAMQVAGVADMNASFDTQFQLPRFNFVLFCTMAGIALVLAIAGIYSVLSYHISQRTREFGVRLALGADRGNILRLVLLTGSKLLAIGVVVGIAGSWGATKVIASQTRIFPVNLGDPAALAVTITGLVVLCGAAFAACCIPARRAMKVDPLVALRAE